MTTRAKETMMIFAALLLAGTILYRSPSSAGISAVFRYDQAAFPKAKPWTSENFKNNPDNVPFVMAQGQERSTGGEPKISGMVWRWVRTLCNDDRMAEPDDSRVYTVHFQEGGIIHVKADCNQKRGTYSVTAEDRRLSIKITRSTKATCPERSLEDAFVSENGHPVREKCALIRQKRWEVPR
jgi:hypothetical protein